MHGSGVPNRGDLFPVAFCGHAPGSTLRTSDAIVFTLAPHAQTNDATPVLLFPYLVPETSMSSSRSYHQRRHPTTSFPHSPTACANKLLKQGIIHQSSS